MPVCVGHGCRRYSRGHTRRPKEFVGAENARTAMIHNTAAHPSHLNPKVLKYGTHSAGEPWNSVSPPGPRSRSLSKMTNEL